METVVDVPWLDVDCPDEDDSDSRYKVIGLPEGTFAR